MDSAVIAQENMLTKGPALEQDEINSSQLSGIIG